MEEFYQVVILKMSLPSQNMSASIRKERIRQEGQKALALLQRDLAGEKNVSHGNELDVESLERARLTKFVHADEIDLSRFEKDLAIEYAMHFLSNADRADAWLDALPLLAIDPENARKPVRSEHLLAKLLSKLPRSGFLNVADVEELKESCDKCTLVLRENRQTIKVLGAGLLLLPISFDALAFEFLKGSGQPNVMPPLLFTLISGVFLLLGANSVRRDFPNRNYVPLFFKLMAITFVLFGLLVMLKMPTELYALFFFLNVFGNGIAIAKKMIADP